MMLSRGLVAVAKLSAASAMLIAAAEGHGVAALGGIVLALAIVNLWSAPFEVVRSVYGTVPSGGRIYEQEALLG